jgi:hypothetical protein
MAQQRQRPLPVADFAAFERDLRTKMLAVEAELLGDEMRKADVDVPALEIRGTTYRRVLRCPQTYQTAAGEVQVERTLYKDHTDGGARALCPLDLRLGVVEGRWTPMAAKQAVFLVAHLTPAHAEQTLQTLAVMTPSRSSLDRLSKATSERWEEQRAELEEALRATVTVPDEAVTLAVSLDGVLAPMKDGEAVVKREQAAAEGKLTRGPAGYREVGVGTVSFCDAEGKTLATIRMGRMPQEKKVDLKAMLKAEVARACELRPDLRVVKVADGAKDNWEFLHTLAPEGENILDFFHAAEHLDRALGAAYGEGSVKARERFATLRHVLLEQEGGVDKVIRALDHVRRSVSRGHEAVTTEVKFFRRHRSHMRYAAWQKAGLPIGSGVVEAACKTLVTQRLKQSGMRWGHPGGQAVVTVRGWVQSERFEQAWALVAALYRAEVTVLANVIPLFEKPAKVASR